MAIKINDLSVIQQDNQVIPHAAGHADSYLRTLARYVQEIAPPVTMELDTVEAARGMGGGKRLCLVLVPDSPRLRRYKTAHYARPVGAALDVGFWLLGGEYQNGRSLGVLNIGAATDVDVNEVVAIVQMVSDYAIRPAINEIVQAITPGHQPGDRGFLGA